MKASNLIGVAALSGVLLIGCGVNVVTVQAQPVYQQTAVSQPVDTAQQSRDRGIAALKHRLEMDQLQEEFDATLEEGMSVKIQCFEYCRDDADYLRGWGVGTGADRQTARQHALDNAKRKLHRKFVPVPGSIASLRDTARARLDSLLLDAEVVCEEYGQVIDPWGYEHHSCEIVIQRPREAYQRTPGYDFLVVTAATPGRSCMECRADDADYLRGWGRGEDADRQTARQHALDDAKDDLRSKFVPVPGSIASLRDTARARLDSLLLDAEVVCEEYDLRFDLLGYDRHVCEIILQSPREAYQRMPGYDSLVTVTRARERQERIKANFQKFTGGLQEPAQDKSDLKPDK